MPKFIYEIDPRPVRWSKYATTEQFDAPLHLFNRIYIQLEFVCDLVDDFFHYNRSFWSSKPSHGSIGGNIGAKSTPSTFKIVQRVATINSRITKVRHFFLGALKV